MSEDLFEKLKEKLNIADVVEHYGVKLNGHDMAQCPFPGHQDNTPSFAVKRNENYFKCFGCGEGGDCIAFVSKLFDIDMLAAAKKLADDFGIDIEERKPVVKVQSIKDYLVKCHSNAAKTTYWHERGISDESVKRFRLGYDTEKKCITIPYSGDLAYYQTRSVAGKVFYKPSVAVAGNEPLFNEKALNGETPVFVVESPICAISIMQCDGTAVALCGTSGAGKLIDKVKAMQNCPPIVLCLDNDSPGKTATEKIIKAFQKAGTAFIAPRILEKCKDPNELLMKNADTLKRAMATAMEQAKSVKPKKRIGTVELSDLLKMELPKTKWFVDGMLPEGLHIIAAPSKAGKSWMMLQLAIAVAGGSDFFDKKTHQAEVLYYALEDGLERIKKRALQVLNGNTPPRGVYFATSVGTMDNGLFEDIRTETAQHPNVRLVIIDTLQKVRGSVEKNEGVYSYDYREMSKFKDFGMANGITFLLVHHLRKMGDDDSFNRISGSNGLMGACDSAFTMTKDKRSDDNTFFDMTGRDIENSQDIITFNKATHCWERVVNAEKQVKRNAKNSYENDLITKTIKALVGIYPYYWTGNMTELMQQCGLKLGEVMPSTPNKIASQINEYEVLLAADGILHTRPNKNGGKNGRKHTFEFRRRIPVQTCLLDEN